MKLTTTLKANHLARTDWLDQFNKQQQNYLRKCVEQGIDISPFAKPEYSQLKMKFLCEAMHEPYDSSNLFRFAHLDLGLLKALRRMCMAGVDNLKYYSDEYTYDKLEEIKLGLVRKVDVSVYDDPTFPTVLMRCLRELLEHGHDAKPYANPQLTSQQIKALGHGIYNGFDMSKYAIEEYKPAQLREITEGLKEDLDVNCYDDYRFTSDQMKYIRKGLEDRLDVSLYANHEIDVTHMRYMYNLLSAIKLAKKSAKACGYEFEYQFKKVDDDK